MCKKDFSTGYGIKLGIERGEGRAVGLEVLT